MCSLSLHVQHDRFAFNKNTMNCEITAGACVNRAVNTLQDHTLLAINGLRTLMQKEVRRPFDPPIDALLRVWEMLFFWPPHAC